MFHWPIMEVSLPLYRVETLKQKTLVFWLKFFHGVKPCAAPCELFSFIENESCRCSLSSAVILGARFLRSTLTIQIKARRSLSDSFLLLSEFCLVEEVFRFLSKAVITFDTVPLEILSIWPVSVTLAPAIRAPTNCPVGK